MSEEKQQTSTPDASAPVDSVQASGKDAEVVEDNVSIEDINKATGREFKSVEEFNKKLDGLESLVGDQTVATQRKNSDAYLAQLEKLKPLAEAEGVSPEAYLEYKIKDEQGDLPENVLTPKEYETKKVESEELTDVKNQLANLTSASEKAEVINLIPGSDKHYDDFVAWAKGAGKSISVESFKDSPFNAMIDNTQQQTSVIESNSYISKATQNEYDAAITQAKKSGRVEDWAQVDKLKQQK